MGLAPRSGPNLASRLGLSSPDATTSKAIAQLGYRLQASPQSGDYLLGSGTFAAVYYAQSVSKRSVAIKVFFDTPQADAYFENETRILEQPGFPIPFGPRTYGSFRFTGARPFIVLDYVRGVNFAHYCRDSVPNLSDRCELAESLLRGLARLHAFGYVHRDIHANNVLVAANNQVRLLDFGLAGTIHERAGTVVAGMNENTPYEVREGKRGTEQDDVYAAAGLIILALTEQQLPVSSKPSGDREYLSLCKKVMQERKIPAQLRSILLSGLREADRRPSADALADRIHHWRVTRPRRSRSILRTTALVSLIAVLAWLAYNRYEGLKREVAWSEFLRLSRESDQLSNRDNALVKPYLNRVNDKKLHERGFAVSAAELTQSSEELRNAIRVSQAVPLGQAVVSVMGETPWVESAATIQSELKAIQSDFRAAEQNLEAGSIDDAVNSYERLLGTLASLVKKNAVAQKIEAQRQGFEKTVQSVSPRVKSMPDFNLTLKFVADADTAWNRGDFELAGEQFGRARERLDAWLQTVETDEERNARVSFDRNERMSFETRIAELQSELDKARANAGNKEAVEKMQSQIRTFEGQIASLREELQHSSKDLSERTDEAKNLNASLATTKEKVKELETELAAVQKESSERRAEVERLTAAQQPGNKPPDGAKDAQTTPKSADEWSADFSNKIPSDWKEQPGSSFLVRTELARPILISTADRGQQMITLPADAGKMMSDKHDWTADFEIFVFGTDNLTPPFQVRIGPRLIVPVRSSRGVIEVAGKPQPPGMRWQSFIPGISLTQGCGTLRLNYTAKDKKLTVGMVRLDSAGEFVPFNVTTVNGLSNPKIQIEIGTEGDASGGLQAVRISREGAPGDVSESPSKKKAVP